MYLTTGGAIRHTIMCFEIGILVRGNLVLLDGKAIFVAGAFYGRLVVEVAMNGLRLKLSARKPVSLVVRLSACPALEVIAAVRAERTIAEAVPVISRVLLGCAIVGRVRWR
jgi:hypothetical protein